MSMALVDGEGMMDFSASMRLLIGKILMIAVGRTNHYTEQFSFDNDGYDLAGA